MSFFRIAGGNPLRGTVAASGMKNAATPIIAATLLTDAPCVIENVPRIRDVERMLDILKSLGARVAWKDEHTLEICCRDASLETLDMKAVKSMRSSVLLLGPLLTRFTEFTLPEPGGCIIGNRPLDAHIAGLTALGAQFERTHDLYHWTRKGTLKGAYIILPEFSVTATENVIMAAALAHGTTTIRLAAAEPHVQDLIVFLQKMGAKIEGSGTHTITITGVEELGGAHHRLIPDQIEIGTFAVAAAVTRGDIRIDHVIPEHLDLIVLKLRAIGVHVDFEKETDGTTQALRVRASFPLKSFRLQTFPYPGFPTDLQAPFGVLATQCVGTSLIHDPLYEGRLGYINELIKMGANAVICDPHRVLITGPTPLYGQAIRSLDLRAGATLVIAGLIAEGATTIDAAEILDRGYEHLTERLRMLGATIERIEK